MAFATDRNKQIQVLVPQAHLRLLGTRPGLRPRNLLLAASQALSDAARNSMAQLQATPAKQTPAREIPAEPGDGPDGAGAASHGILGLDKLGIEGLDLPTMGLETQ
jgi:hypothetical protein